MMRTDLVIDRIKTFRRDRRWLSIAIITLLVLIFILGLSRLLLPHTIAYTATSWLKKQGIDSTIEAINIDIIGGTVSLVNAKGYEDGAPLFNVGLVDLYWDWAPLKEKTIVVTKIGLDKFSANIQQYNDKLIIGGVHIPLGATVSEQPEDITEDSSSKKQATPWAASLGEVIFTDLNICYLQHTAEFKRTDEGSLFIDYCVALDEMTWSGTISYATDKALLKTDDIPISSTGDFTLDGLNVTDNKLDKKLLVSKSNALDNVVISGLNSLRIDRLEMNELSLLGRRDDKHPDSIRFSQLSIEDIDLSNLNTITVNNVSMSKPGIYLVKLNSSDWEYQEWIPQVSVSVEPPQSTEAETSAAEKTAFKVALNNLAIDDSDLCYLDNETELYYCLTFEQFKWAGSIDYDTVTPDESTINLQVKGDLELSQPNVHNHTIDRDLVDFDSLTLSGLSISGLDKVSLKKLNIGKLTALQRSTKKGDETASFENLIIDDASYTKNRIDINSIALKGIATTVSKNKDGSWEHDKWQPKDKNKKPEATKETKTSQPKTDEKPMIIAVKKLTVNSDKMISFTDNSTSPAMETGLQSLALSLSELYSDKPDSDSHIKLQAQTTRHSTIDIEGTARPFAEKVSMDVEGKLKGFDLRAASPATKKAIGHTIKSGQMDADLELLAVDGVLDSNIGLSLYHFNIKATSKEDAAKLDEKFGMPLNQTLVLLRDKDDSIHLDIPITGDVNNPEFNPMDAIIKATSKAATVTLITFYTPYGLIYAGGNVAFNMATALNFDPISFAPGSAEIPAAGKEQLTNLSKLLTEKPQVHLTMCGVTNKQDIFTMYPELKEKQAANNKDEEKKGSEIKLSAEQSQQLEKLAKDRQVNSKNYLVEKSGIAHNRLILCAPEHSNDDDAIAGIEINI